ncbi:hypothetical protein [Streptomyces acidiscabies]|uniref:Uncharacterized protein n=1 Tax=Streptomyces acidiscabies TaxID=42234 RepID=A0AAP6B845_9ACTN|nr:hypothetical protein [Streptomyces acidiscabies]MBP5940854.1 hypothetical protein [Streptomyces sp. LBUM 1476]MBZ3912143.1 hypothetical protein [Streptomyces acidiscabies]MDX2959952.1 hypothetical protein [Streptomyces acidiscabies]MDX3024159.1 hypothetical protein [Streptomyces acidiscabies]MDX3794582.1 hypothetical protein [Streptomyces acidiscabies]
MQSANRPGRTAPKRLQPVVELVPEGVDPDEDGYGDDEFDAYDDADLLRVVCPDCVQPIALLADQEVLPEHALCASPWNPFGLTVCAGTGRAAADARSADEVLQERTQDIAPVLTLPQGLDWRTQPFSHVGGPGSRPVYLVRPAQVSATVRRAA